MKGKVIILNGPPGSGKDTIARHMAQEWTYPGFRWMEVKARLFEQALGVSGISDMEWFERYKDRELKETPWDKLAGLSQREFMIKISEEWVKPVFGKDYYGVQAGEAALKYINLGTNVVFSDGGFQEEFDTIKSIVGKNNILLVKLFRDGTSWKGDSRSYLKNNDWEVYIENNGTIQDVIGRIKNEIG